MARPETTHRRGARAAAVAAAVLGGLAVLAACSGDEGADPPTTTDPGTRAPTTSTTPPDEAAEPPEPAWIVQVGGPGEDDLLDVAPSDDSVVASGSTSGQVARPPTGTRDALVVVVGTDGTVRDTAQGANPGAEDARGIASTGDAALACGSVDASTGTGTTGDTDAWCASVGADGAPGALEPFGTPEPDALEGAALVPDGSYGYAPGHTAGLFPGASDPLATTLGGVDAMVWQVDPDGRPRWIRQFGTPEEDRALGVTVAGDGDGLVVGATAGVLGAPGFGGTDAFAARLDPSGLPRWLRQFGTEGTDSAAAVAAGGDAARGTETYVLAGSTTGAVATAFGGEQSTLEDVPLDDGGEPVTSNAGGTDAMVLGLDPAGQQRWAAQLGTEGEDSAAGVAVAGNIVLVAGTTGADIGTAGNPSAGGTDGFLAALDLESGALAWITQFGSPADEVASGLTVTEDGLAVVSGRTAGQMGDTPNAGGTDGFLIAFPLPASGGAAGSIL